MKKREICLPRYKIMKIACQTMSKSETIRDPHCTTLDMQIQKI